MATHTKKHIKRKNTITTRLFNVREGNEKYATINKAFGNGRFECTSENENKIVMGTLANRLISGPHKQRVSVGDLVLLDLDISTTSSEKYYIIYKYSPDEKKKLAKQGEFKQFKNNDDNKTVITMEGDIVSKLETLIIDDAFIDGI